MAVPCRRPLLYHHNAIFIAQLIKVIGFGQSSTPRSHHLNMLTFSNTQQAVIFFSRKIHQSIHRTPTGSLHEHRFTINDESPIITVFSLASRKRSHVDCTNTERCLFHIGASSVTRNKCDCHIVKRLFSHIVRPPKAGSIYFEIE